MKTIIIAFICSFITGMGMYVITYSNQHEVKLLTECPAIEPSYAHMPDGWKCGIPKQNADLLTPDGLLWIDSVSCFKLKKTIPEWCAEFPYQSDCNEN